MTEEEQEKPDEEPEKKPEEKPDEPVAPGAKEPDMIQKAHDAAERLEKANRHKEDLLAKQERILSEQRLGGQAEAGEPQKKDETPEEYAQRVMSGNLKTP